MDSKSWHTFGGVRASPPGVPNRCPIQISAVVIGRIVHTCPDIFFKILVGEGQIQRKSLEPELQNAGGAASSPTINTGEALNFVVTLLRMDAADESRRRTLLEAEWDEDDDIFAAAVWQQMVALAVAELEEERVQGAQGKGKLLI
jgi:hypothetical protein